MRTGGWVARAFDAARGLAARGCGTPQPRTAECSPARGARQHDRRALAVHALVERPEGPAVLLRVVRAAAGVGRRAALARTRVAHTPLKQGTLRRSAGKALTTPPPPRKAHVRASASSCVPASSGRNRAASPPSPGSGAASRSSSTFWSGRLSKSMRFMPMGAGSLSALGKSQPTARSIRSGSGWLPFCGAARRRAAATRRCGRPQHRCQPLQRPEACRAAVEVCMRLICATDRRLCRPETGAAAEIALWRREIRADPYG